MNLTDINLRGLGRFEPDPAAFKVTRYHVPAPWEYQFNNGQALLRLRQDGGTFLQIAPPGGPLLLNQERHGIPAMFTWIIPQDGSRRRGPDDDLSAPVVKAFSNFCQPQIPVTSPGAEPEEYSGTYHPEMARYRVDNDPGDVETDVWLAPDEIAAPGV